MRKAAPPTTRERSLESPRKKRKQYRFEAVGYATRDAGSSPSSYTTSSDESESSPPLTTAAKPKENVAPKTISPEDRLEKLISLQAWDDCWPYTPQLLALLGLKESAKMPDGWESDEDVWATLLVVQHLDEEMPDLKEMIWELVVDKVYEFLAG